MQVGQTAPLHCTALDKALLSFGGLETTGRRERFTPRTIIDPDRLARSLAYTHPQGYAVDDEEFEQDVRCLAAPVFDHRSTVVAAIGISGPAIVMEVAGALSERMGFVRP